MFICMSQKYTKVPKMGHYKALSHWATFIGTMFYLASHSSYHDKFMMCPLVSM